MIRPARVKDMQAPRPSANFRLGMQMAIADIAEQVGARLEAEQDAVRGAHDGYGQGVVDGLAAAYELVLSAGQSGGKGDPEKASNKRLMTAVKGTK